MSVVKQRIWDAASEEYCDGPNLIPDTKSFAGHCCRQDVAKSKKIGIRRTHIPGHDAHQDLLDDEDIRFRTTRRLRPTGNKFAGFKRGCMVTSEIWLTTYPFIERRNNHLGETMLFHVHSSVEAIDQPPEAPAVNWISSWLFGSGVDPPEVSSWRTPITSLQFAPAPTANVHDIDLDDDGQQPSFVVNQGPILRSNIDVLYLDKSFWRQYFARYSPNKDVLIPGVYPKDLAQVQNVAVDVAVLRNRDEFAAVTRAVRRHLPHMISFSAVVTKIIPRPVAEPLGQIALLEDGLPDVFVSFEEKVRLGVHESADLVPAQGIVSANLNRLNVSGTPDNRAAVVQTRYMLLAYFDDAVQSLHGGSPDVDLPIAQDQGGSFLPALNVPKREINTASPESRTRRNNNPQTPIASRNQRGSTQSNSRPGRSTIATGRNLLLGKDLGRRRNISTTPSPKDDKTNISRSDRTPGQDKINQAKQTTIKAESSSGKAPRNTPGNAPARDPAQSPTKAFRDIRDTTPFSTRRTAEQLAATRRAQVPMRTAFRADHPGAYLRIPTSGEGALCAWRAIQASWDAAIPRIAQATRLPAATLVDMVTLETLEAERVRDRQSPAAVATLGRSGMVDVRNFTADYAARIFRQLVWRRTGLPMDLGCIGPLQRAAFGGNSGDLSYMVLDGGPQSDLGGDQSLTAAAAAPPAISRVWIWNNNEPGAGHYEGIRDAPQKVR